MNTIRNYFFGFALFLAGQVYSQDCTLKKTTDDFSGMPKVSSGFIDIQGIDLSIDATGKEIDYFFVIRNPATNCIGAESEAVFVFEGGKARMTMRNTGGDNCNGYFHTVMKGGQYTPANVQKLATKKVVSITFSDRNDKKTTISLTTQQQEQLMKLSDCIAKEAKALPR
ncbi:hypothetical protein [Flavihumibacter fluvii]|uniref:hypothetical protein n=1 Tax=Flavihumibacter fluvii TaxID=2838157 RepID=UPI001BDDF270|nr:hypothetical protein [Flavihumibacter fluvii]ULQ53735.1 hypothetical protein KJS93_05285 [Flavihumibacter fluvii]